MTGFKFGEFTWNRKIALYKAKQKKKKEKIKFEHILQIYWTKGFFFGGRLFYTNKNFYELFHLTPGIGRSFRHGILKRLELDNRLSVNLTPVTSFKRIYKIEVVNFLNQYYSQVNSVNNVISDLQRLNIIRLYLIKSYKGKCHSIGKPSNGQRTWSNGWTAYNTNYILRKFLNETRFKLNKDRTPEKINYKLTKKKYITKKKSVTTVKRKISTWF